MNPAYSYMRPWLVSTVSLTLMTTTQFFIKGILNPGYCPYFSSLRLNDIFRTQQLI